MSAFPSFDPPFLPAAPPASMTWPTETTFEELYDAYARFVWRALVRLGVTAADVEDVMQEVFVVVHRRLADFRQESTARTWVYGIAVHVARNHRRSGLRRPRATPNGEDGDPTDRLPETSERAPDALLAKARAGALLIELLGELDESSREVFVLAELEEMTANEMGEVLGLSPNTVSSRLRLARRAFDLAVRRHRARDQWRLR